MSISIINSQVKDFVYVPPREKCVRPTLCPFRVRTHQVLLRTHVCVYIASLMQDMINERHSVGSSRDLLPWVDCWNVGINPMNCLADFSPCVLYNP